MNRTRKRIVPNVVRGGTAIPIGDNLYYMKGRKHEQGGIDIGNNAKTGLEVEGGEVLQTSPNSIRVFSSVPFLYGESPANLVRAGVNPNNIFNAQERFKDINKLNDDGSMKQYKNGGLSRSKNYGSSKKPYPSVKSEDFAGGNRSYPIPTKADAVDALRLAGLHGRSDVKAKVYRKYPELRNKKPFGGDYLTDIIQDLENSQRTRTAERNRRADVLLDTPLFTINRNSKDDYISNLQKELELSQAERIAEREKRANILRTTPIMTINRNSNNDKKESQTNTSIVSRYDRTRQKIYNVLNRIPSTGNLIRDRKEYLEERRLENTPDYSMPEFNELTGVGVTPWSEQYEIETPYGIDIARFNNTNFNNERVPFSIQTDAKGIQIPVTQLEVPSFNVDDLVTRALIETLPENKNETNVNSEVNTSSSSKGIGQQTPTTSRTRTVSTVPATKTTPIISVQSNVPQRELDETYRQYSGAIQRNVPLPTGKAVALTDNAKVLFDNRLKQNIVETAERNKNERTKNGTDYTSLILDGIGSLANIGGNIASNIINRRMLNDLEYSSAPIPLSPAKLKTRININPQLQRLYRDLGIMEDSVNSNTTSSRTALARNQRLRNQARQIANELYGNKENIETQLINRDRLNQQQVAASNLARYDKWLAGKTEFNNKVREMLSENDVALTQGVAGAISDMLNSIATRNQEAKNLAYLSMSNPYAVEALNSTDFKNLYRMYGGFRCGGKKKINRK